MSMLVMVFYKTGPGYLGVPSYLDQHTQFGRISIPKPGDKSMKPLLKEVALKRSFAVFFIVYFEEIC